MKKTLMASAFAIAVATVAHASEDRMNFTARASYQDCGVAERHDRLGIKPIQYRLGCGGGLGLMIMADADVRDEGMLLIISGFPPITDGECVLTDTAVACSLPLLFSHWERGREWDVVHFGDNQPHGINNALVMIEGRNIHAFIAEAKKADDVKASVGGTVYTVSLRGFNAAYKDFKARLER